MKEGTVVEWAPFTLAQGVDEAALLAASDALQEAFLAGRPGFVRRELLRGSDGQWVDLVEWESEEAAARAVEDAARSEACFRYFRIMAGADQAEPGAGVLHFARVKAYTR